MDHRTKTFCLVWIRHILAALQIFGGLGVAIALVMGFEGGRELQSLLAASRERVATST